MVESASAQTPPCGLEARLVQGCVGCGTCNHVGSRPAASGLGAGAPGCRVWRSIQSSVPARPTLSHRHECARRSRPLPTEPEGRRWATNYRVAPLCTDLPSRPVGGIDRSRKTRGRCDSGSFAHIRPIAKTPELQSSASVTIRRSRPTGRSQGGGTGSNPVGGTQLKPLTRGRDRLWVKGFADFWLLTAVTCGDLEYHPATARGAPFVPNSCRSVRRHLHDRRLVS